MRLLFASVLVFAMTAFGADQAVTGVITDSMCRMNHAMMQKGANKMSDHDCTVACVKSGQKGPICPPFRHAWPFSSRPPCAGECETSW